MEVGWNHMSCTYYDMDNNEYGITSTDVV
eukprot:SAG31_NODE_31109_length_372_cov_0.725275_1_plen_28_part_10